MSQEFDGAALFRGEGRLPDPRTIEVGGVTLRARRAVVVVNGSTAAIPDIPGLPTVDFGTNRQAAIPRELPAALAILGGNARGIELGQAFARLGSTATIVIHPFPAFNRVLGQAFRELAAKAASNA